MINIFIKYRPWWSPFKRIKKLENGFIFDSNTRIITFKKPPKEGQELFLCKGSYIGNDLWNKVDLKKR